MLKFFPGGRPVILRTKIVSGGKNVAGVDAYPKRHSAVGDDVAQVSKIAAQVGALAGGGLQQYHHPGDSGDFPCCPEAYRYPPYPGGFASAEMGSRVGEQIGDLQLGCPAQLVGKGGDGFVAGAFFRAGEVDQIGTVDHHRLNTALPAEAEEGLQFFRGISASFPLALVLREDLHHIGRDLLPVGNRMINPPGDRSMGAEG